MYSNFKLWYNGCAYSLPTLTALNFWTSKSSCWWFVALWKSHAKTSVNVGGVPVRISNFHKRQQIIMKKNNVGKGHSLLLYKLSIFCLFLWFSCWGDDSWINGTQQKATKPTHPVGQRWTRHKEVNAVAGIGDSPQFPRQSLHISLGWSWDMLRYVDSNQNWEWVESQISTLKEENSSQNSSRFQCWSLGLMSCFIFKRKLTVNWVHAK